MSQVTSPKAMPHKSATSSHSHTTMSTAVSSEFNTTCIGSHSYHNHNRPTNGVSMPSGSQHARLSWTVLAKAASTSNVVKNAPQKGFEISSSVPASPMMPHHGQRPSLAGFDPFLSAPLSPSTNTTPTAKDKTPLADLKTKHPTNNHTSRVVMNPPSPHISANVSKKEAVPVYEGNNLWPLEKTVEKRSQSNRETSPTLGQGNDARQPPTPSKSPISSPSAAVNFTVEQHPSSPLKQQKERRSNQPSSATCKRIPFLRKGHRRSRSDEGNSNKNDSNIAVPTSQDNYPISPTLEPYSDAKEDTYNKANSSVVQELMDLKDKFIQLQIPSLAKPSPTSFLTGKGEEAVRTSEYEPSPFQMEIPSLPEVVEMARLNHFVENYRRIDQNFDLRQFIGCSRIDLEQVKIKEHIPIVQSLKECGDELTVQGYLSKGTNADDRLEAVVFEGQRYFTVIFRGTTEQQTKLLGNSKSKRRAVPFDPEQQNVEVYSGFQDEYSKLEKECFTLVDKLSEQNPFCDVVFSGFSFGAAMATLAASRYAIARPMMRVGCLTLASPKVGFSLFRHVVNSLPNLKVIRLELGQDAKCQGPTVGGWHVGHTLVLSGCINHQTQKAHKTVQAYKFDTPKHKKFKTTHPDLRYYITTLEEMARLNIPWVEDFVNTSGQGVVVNNEARQVV